MGLRAPCAGGPSPVVFENFCHSLRRATRAACRIFTSDGPGARRASGCVMRGLEAEYSDDARVCGL